MKFMNRKLLAVKRYDQAEFWEQVARWRLVYETFTIENRCERLRELRTIRQSRINQSNGRRSCLKEKIIALEQLMGG